MSEKPVLYLAGPMSGFPQFNFPLFDAIAKQLRADGYIVVSPHECDSPETQAAAWASSDGKYTDTVGNETWGDCLARDVKMLADGYARPDSGDVYKIDAIALMDGWQKSRGARLEAFVGLLTGKHYFEVRAITDNSGQWSDTSYVLEHRSSHWVENELAKDWAGLQIYRPLRGAPLVQPDENGVLS